MFKDSDSDSSPFVRTRTRTRMQRTRTWTRTRTLRTRTRTRTWWTHYITGPRTLSSRPRTHHTVLEAKDMASRTPTLRDTCTDIYQGTDRGRERANYDDIGHKPYRPRPYRPQKFHIGHKKMSISATDHIGHIHIGHR